MQRILPTVVSGWLSQPMTGTAPIAVGTPAWFVWLEQHSAFTFVDPLGTLIVNKSSSHPDGSTWEASFTQGSRHFRVWLGSSRTLTLAHMQDAAGTLAAQHAPSEPSEMVASEYLSPERAARLRHSYSLLRTKLTRPRLPSDVIPRPRLLERISAGLGDSLTLLCAPAGYGKTTLLAQWLATVSRPVAWLSLDAADNDLAVFMYGFTTAVQNIEPDACQASANLLHIPQLPPLQEVITLLINDLADVPEDIIVVLDDYHLIQASEIHTLLVELIEHLPQHLHLVLSSRAEPPLPLTKWRAKGQLHDLDTADVRFTLEETHIFLARLLGNDLANETARALAERTEGWVTALRLAALSLRGTADRAAFLARFGHAPDRTMSEYLVEEVLADIAPTEQDVLLRLSLLEQFNATSGATTLGGTATPEQVQALLDEWERTNLFLVPLDDRQGWFRFRHLFRAVLQQRLQTHVSQEERDALHQRASGWYAGQGLVDEALHHALAAGDAPGAAQLVAAQFLPAFEQERLMQMESWLRLVPEEQIQNSPGLLVARVWILQAHRQVADLPRVLTAAEQLLATSESSASDLDDRQSRLLRALIAVWWSQFQFFYTGQTQASLVSALSALEWFPAGEQYVASFALMYLAFSRHATGQLDVALVELNKALSDHSTHFTSTARLLFTLSFINLAAGKLHQVEQTARQLFNIAQKADLALSQNMAHWLFGVVAYERNDLNAAVYHYSTVIANRHLAHFWVVREAQFGLAFAYQAQGFDTRAQEIARDLLEWVQNQHNMRDLTTAYAFCGQLALAQDEVEAAAQWLDLVGEQQVLGPMMYFEDLPITRAWLLLTKGDQASVAEAQAHLTRLAQHVEAIHNTRKSIMVMALQAWTYELQGRTSDALAILERAIVLARPASFIRTFADVPALARLLQMLRKRTKARREGDSNLDTYLQRILIAMYPGDAQAVSTEALLRREGLEPLTERELQVLHLLDNGLTNKEIAHAMVVTPGTVKVHTNNLYRKLTVDNRRAAVSLAKALGLLAVEQAPKLQ